jgi:UbiD family decarboxylase
MAHMTASQNRSYRGLRGWIDTVDRLGELKRVSGAHWDVEMGAVTHMLTEKSGGTAPAILFDDVPGYPKGYRTLYGQLSSIKRIALTLGLPLEHERQVDIVQRYHVRMGELKPLPPRYVNDGPILENVIEGDTVDVLRFPVPRHHEQDKARFIGTADCVVTKDPDSGWYNLGAYRSQVYDGRTVGCQITEGKHGRIHRDKYFARGEPMKVVILCGQDPLLFMLSSSPLPEVSEYDIAGGLRGEPIDVVRGPYTGFPIPADCEIAIEGETVPGHTKPEGPFGEWMGYYSDDTQERPYVDVKTILHRNDPILTCAPQHKPVDETGLLKGIAGAAQIWRALESAGFRMSSACGTTRRVPPRGSLQFSFANAIRGMPARRCTWRAPARAAPMPASGPWSWTRTSMPAISIRSCGRCARASTRRSTSTLCKRRGHRSAIRSICPAISTIASWWMLAFLTT